jgi:hypothetical protein
MLKLNLVLITIRNGRGVGWIVHDLLRRFEGDSASAMPGRFTGLKMLSRGRELEVALTGTLLSGLRGMVK